MRDFRDAKAMARTLRANLDAQGVKVTVSQSLELIAKAFGAADWNTLSAAIRDAAPAAATPPPPTTVWSAPPPSAGGFSEGLALGLHRAFTDARARKHEYTTLEHLLLALLDDADTRAVMLGCQVDIDALRQALAGYIEQDLGVLVVEGAEAAKPTAGFQRTIQRAVVHVRASGLAEVTGAEVLTAMFSETESHAAILLARQGVTRLDAVNFLAHGNTKDGGDAAA